MKITDSQVNLSSQHSLIEQESRQETLRLQQNGRTLTIEVQQDKVSISEQAQNLWSAQTQNSSNVSSSSGVDASGLSDIDKQRITLIERMLEMLTGKKVRLRVFDPSRWAQRQEPTLSTSAGAGCVWGWIRPPAWLPLPRSGISCSASTHLIISVCPVWKRTSG